MQFSLYSFLKDILNYCVPRSIRNKRELILSHNFERNEKGQRILNIRIKNISNHKVEFEVQGIKKSELKDLFKLDSIDNYKKYSLTGIKGIDGEKHTLEPYEYLRFQISTADLEKAYHPNKNRKIHHLDLAIIGGEQSEKWIYHGIQYEITRNM